MTPAKPPAVTVKVFNIEVIMYDAVPPPGPLSVSEKPTEGPLLRVLPEPKAEPPAKKRKS